jgi:RNA polymerase sigma-70 factor (ECF subfamily)
MPHEPGVRAWLQQSAVSGADIDDLIQEAYCKLAGLDSVEHIGRPDSYFFQLVRNLLMDQMRRARVVRIDTVAEIDTLSVLSDAPSPERIATSRQELERVRRLIAALPERCRRVFELRKIEGVSQREIAARLGISESAVENEGVRGMRLIMQALRAEGTGVAELSKVAKHATGKLGRD